MEDGEDGEGPCLDLDYDDYAVCGLVTSSESLIRCSIHSSVNVESSFESRVLNRRDRLAVQVRPSTDQSKELLWTRLKMWSLLLLLSENISKALKLECD